MLSMNMRSVIVTTLCALAWLLPGYTHAYTVAPVIVDRTLEPRSIENFDIVITNDTNAILQLFPAVNNVSVGLSGGIESFVPASMSDRTTSLASWIELSRTPIELGPGQSATTTATIRIIADAEPGTYHALISFPDGRNRDEAEARIQNGGVPSTILTVTIEKKTREELGLSGFIVDRFVLSPDNEAAAYTVANSGDTDIVPTGDILIYNHRGEEVAVVPVNPSRASVKAGETVVMRAQLPTAGLAGKYKAYLSLKYGTEQRAQIQDTAFFYAVPWKKLLILFFGLLLVAIALALVVHRRYEYDSDDDGSEYLPLHVKDGVSGATHHDIDMKPRI
jgi:hypothetical protein